MLCTKFVMLCKIRQHMNCNVFFRCRYATYRFIIVLCLACEFGWLSTNNPPWIQDVSFNICLASSHSSLTDRAKHELTQFHVFDVLIVHQCSKMPMFIFLALTLWCWLDLGVCCIGTFYASVCEKIKKEMSFLSTLTCVHHPISLLHTSGMRNVTDLCLLAYGLKYMNCLHLNRM